MLNREETRRIARQTAAMLRALDDLSPLGSLLSPVEVDLLRALLVCARDCAEAVMRGKWDPRAASELAIKHQRFSDAVIAAAVGGNWGGGEPDLRGLLLNRLFDSDHPFLRASEEQSPAAVPRMLQRLIRRDLKNIESLARPRWGEWLSLANVDINICLDPLAGDGEEPEAVGDLKERFAQSDDWAGLSGDLGRLVHEYGRGPLRRFPAFRLNGEGAEVNFDPIRDFAGFPLGWLEGNEARIQTIEDNTRNFIAGYRAHNTLIWGPRGGGKSTLIRALVGKFYAEGLRAVEISSADYQALPALFSLVRGRCQRFVGVLDNISFDRGDETLQILSRVLDGGLEECPGNLVFYATSNYKDLVDREGERPGGLGQMQLEDGQSHLVNQAIRPEFYDPQQLQRLDEERALDDRFALKVFLDLPRKNQYQGMVLSYARRAGIDLPEEELFALFEVWRMRHNHDLVGGRTARDFILSYLPQHLRGEED